MLTEISAAALILMVWMHTHFKHKILLCLVSTVQICRIFI